MAHEAIFPRGLRLTGGGTAHETCAPRDWNTTGTGAAHELYLPRGQVGGSTVVALGDLDASLWGYWALDESSDTDPRADTGPAGTRELVDVLGAGSNLTSASGKQGRCLQASDSSTPVWICDTDADLSGGRLALSVWFRDSAPNWWYWGDVDGARAWGLYAMPGGTTLRARVTQSDSTVVSVTASYAPYDDGNWHHALMVATGTRLYLAVDGSVLGSAAYDGTLADGAGDWLTCRIRSVLVKTCWLDELAAWIGADLALSEAQVAGMAEALWNSGIGRTYRSGVWGAPA